MGITEFLTLTATYKWWGVLLCFIGWAILRIFDRKLVKFADDGKIKIDIFNKDNKLPPLSEHPIFTNIDYRINYTIKHLNIPCPLRKKVFVDLLTIKHEICLSFSEKLVNDTDNGKINTIDKFRSRCHTDFYASFDEFRKKIKDEGIPDIVFDKFRLWHDDRISTIEHTIENVCNTEFLSTIKERVAMLLSSYDYVSSLTLFDAEKTLKSLNGDLDFMTYKNQECRGTCKKCPRRKQQKNEKEKEIDIQITKID